MQFGVGFIGSLDRLSTYEVDLGRVRDTQIVLFAGTRDIVRAAHDRLHPFQSGVARRTDLRLGADEATTIVLEKGIKIGDAAIPAGSYTLYLIPEENGGKLAFSKTVGRWGIPVDQKHDLVRVDVKKEALSPALDQLAIAIEKADNGGALKIKWEDSQYSVNFTNG